MSEENLTANTAPRPSTSPPGQGLAIASLVLSLLTILFGFFATIPGIVMGHMARAKDKDNGLALAGLIIGYFFLVVQFIIIGLFGIFALYISEQSSEFADEVQKAMEQAQQMQTQIEIKDMTDQYPQDGNPQPNPPKSENP